MMNGCTAFDDRSRLTTTRGDTERPSSSEGTIGHLHEGFNQSVEGLSVGDAEHILEALE